MLQYCISLKEKYNRNSCRVPSADIILLRFTTTSHEYETEIIRIDSYHL